MNDNGPGSIDAVKALRARGIGNAEDLLEYGTPAEILGACHRWDQRKNVGPGVLAAMIRNGEFVDEQPARPAAPTSASRLRARFDEYAARFPEGSVAEPHARLQARRWPQDERCAGSMIVVDAIYPLLAMECDECGFLAALPAQSLHILDGQTNEAPF